MDDRTTFRQDGTKPTVHILHHTLRRGGGMEQYALIVASTLKTMGHTVVFHSHAVDSAVVQEIGVEVENLAVSRFPRKLQDFRYFRSVNRIPGSMDGVQIALSRVRSRDLVICGGTHLGYLKRARKVTGPLDLLQIWMEKEAYRSARVVISHSDLCRDELLRLYRVPGEKVIVVYPPIESRFGPAVDEREREQTRRELALPLDKPVLLFPSMGHRRKGLRPICEALDSFSAELVLAVAGKRSSNAGRGYIRQLGYIDDMAPVYRAVDFTILGSYYEPFGLVGPESVMCGTRLLFEENIGCLTAIKPEAVLTFSVRNIESIRSAVGVALDLARKRQQRLENPASALLYDPSPVRHAELLLRAAGPDLRHLSSSLSTRRS